MAYGSYVLMHDINFTVAPGEIMVIMGGSGCGKSTLLKYLIGLKEVEKGEIIYRRTKLFEGFPEGKGRDAKNLWCVVPGRRLMEFAHPRQRMSLSLWSSTRTFLPKTSWR